jgi:hypothetical protein
VKAILPAHVVWVYLNLDGLLNNPVHVSELGAEDGDVLELNVVAQVDAVFGCCGFVWLLQMDVTLVLLDPSLVEQPVCPT